MNSCGERLKNGLIDENPIFVLMLGMCPTLAVTTSAMNGIGMGLSTTAVLVMSNMLISMLRKIIPDSVRMPAFIVVVASFVTIVDFLMEGYTPSLYDSLGIYIPLIVVNCIILGRAESYASKNPVLPSIFDGLGMGLGFTVGLLAIGAVREIIGAGQIFGKQILQLADSTMGKAGYTPILYMNLNWYNNFVDWNVLEGSGLDVWIASYGDTILAPSTSKYKYTIWQCTAGDEVPGMISTKKLISGVPKENNVDLNFGYVDYTTKVVPRWNSQEGYTPAKQPLYSDPKLHKNGWTTVKGRKYYYTNDKKAKGWLEIDGKYYCFSSVDGHLYKSKLIKKDGTAYYVDKNGVRVENKVVTKKDKTYYFGADGKALTGMRKVGRKYYYFSTTSFAMEKNYKYVAANGSIYYFGSKGYRAKNKFITLTENSRKNTYYFGKNGKAYKGWYTIK